MRHSAALSILRCLALAGLLALGPAARGQNLTNSIAVNINAFTNRILDAVLGPGQPACSGVNARPTTNLYTFTVTGLGSVVDLNLRLSVLHSYVADLDIKLISPSGYQARITNDIVIWGIQPGPTGDNFQDTLFDEQAGTIPINQGTSPYAGTYTATFSPDRFTRYNGINPNGTWTLVVVDNGPCDDGFLLWPGANPRALDDLILDAVSMIGESWGTNALGTRLVLTTAPCSASTATLGGGGTICSGTSTNVTVTVSGGTPPYIVTLNNGGGTRTNASPLTFTVSPSATTTYSIVAALDANGCVATPAGSATVTVNRTPVAGPDSLATTFNQAAVVSTATLLANDSDPDGGGVTFLNVSPNSARGGTVSLAAGNVTYRPPTNFFGADTFPYLIGDAGGCTTNGTVSVSVEYAAGHLLTVSNVNNLFQLQFIGVPGSNYFFQTATNPSGPWSNLVNAFTVGTSGVVTTNDTNVPFPASKLYRVTR